ncbi:MAG: TRAP transporter small permease [Planctomycetes bacterium]|nr:TRAP transporter small permease [Planctomycetota bacterium]
MFQKVKRWNDIGATILLIACIICIVLQIIFRYLLRLSMPWTEEMARYCLVAVTYAGSAAACSEGEHLGAFFLRDRAQGRIKGAMYLFNNLVCVAFELFLVVGSYQMFFVTGDIPAVTIPVVRVSWLYVVMGLAALFMLWCSLIDVVHSCRIVISGDSAGLRDGYSSPFLTQE